MRLLLDTNILLPMEDPDLPLGNNMAHVVRLANANNHELVYHPATEADIQRDPNTARQQKTLRRLHRYSCLERSTAPCPWNTEDTKPHDREDNEILYALKCDAAHILITEDQGIHDTAWDKGLGDRVFTIQTMEDWLQRLHERTSVSLPNIEDAPLHDLTSRLNESFFDSLRESYYGFEQWFRRKAKEGKTKAWFCQDGGALAAICIYTEQDNEQITQKGRRLPGTALKLSTFKVDTHHRGKKIGELFLKAVFRYATQNRIENIFIHGDPKKQHFLFKVLVDFGFINVGTHPGSGGSDAVYLKQHPSRPPDNKSGFAPFEFFQRYFPHFLTGQMVGKFVVPIQPGYHDILFPDCDQQPSLFQPTNTAGNAIKMAYLCHAPTKKMNPGDVVLFYRSQDQRAITTLGVVERYETLNDPNIVARLVKRRTVYGMGEIQRMAKKNSGVRVMLFRIVRHFSPSAIPLDWLTQHKILKGPPQSIVRLSDPKFDAILFTRPPQLTGDRTVLISIHPSYVKKILSGEKRLEFRRRWASGPVDKLVIYSTAPVKKLVATARVERVITGTKNELWEQAKRAGGGVTEDELFRYLEGKEIAVAIELSEVNPFPPLDPKIVFGPDFTPPQSFRFLKPNEMDQLGRGMG